MLVRVPAPTLSGGVLGVYGSYLIGDGGGSVTHSRPTLCHPMDCNLPGSSVYGISQVRFS